MIGCVGSFHDPHTLPPPDPALDSTVDFTAAVGITLVGNGGENWAKKPSLFGIWRLYELCGPFAATVAL